MRIQPLFPLALCLVSLAAQADGVQRYTCQDDSRLLVSYSAADGRPQATVRLNRISVTLPRAPSASGTLYRRGDVLLAVAGDRAVFQDGQGGTRRCVNAAAPRFSRAPAVRSSFVDVAGSIGYGATPALPADAVLTIRVEDRRRGQAARTLAEQSIVLGNRQLHIPFRTTIDRDLLEPKTRLVVTADIAQGGSPRYRGEGIYTVSGDANSVPAQIWLAPVGEH